MIRVTRVRGSSAGGARANSSRVTRVRVSSAAGAGSVIESNQSQSKCTLDGIFSNFRVRVNVLKMVYF